MSNQNSFSACPISTAVEGSMESLPTESSNAQMTSEPTQQEGGLSQNAQPTNPKTQNLLPSREPAAQPAIENSATWNLLIGQEQQN